MSYSNRRSHRPDPTIAPVVRDLNGELVLRPPFSHSEYHIQKEAKARDARVRNRQGYRP